MSGDADLGPIVSLWVRLPATTFGDLAEAAELGGVSTAGLARSIIAVWLRDRRNPPRPPAPAPEPPRRRGRGPARRKPQMVAPATPAPLHVDTEAEIADLESSLPT